MYTISNHLPMKKRGLQKNGYITPVTLPKKKKVIKVHRKDKAHKIPSTAHSWAISNMIYLSEKFSSRNMDSSLEF